MKTKIGFEIEYAKKENGIFSLLYGDAYPILGEARGDPSENASIAAASVLSKIPKDVVLGHFFVDIEQHRKAMSAMRHDHNKQIELNKVKNIYGTQIDDISDCVIKDGKNIGHTISCGLHIHVSMNEESRASVKTGKYELLSLPLGISGLNASIPLYRNCGFDETIGDVVRASALTVPVVKELVSILDKKYANLLPDPPQTKYRRPGFWEPKPWGFEYRSLPANEATVDFKFLVEVGNVIFDYLGGITIKNV